MDSRRLTNNGMLLRYKWRMGMTNWIFHRISGIALIFYLVAHMFVVRWIKDSAASGNPEAFEHVLKVLENPILGLMEILLLAAVLFHALNGIRVLVVDFFDGAKYHKRLDVILWVVFLALLIPTAITMLISIFA